VGGGATGHAERDARADAYTSAKPDANARRRRGFRLADGQRRRNTDANS